jgi:hypothetical protein
VYFFVPSIDNAASLEDLNDVFRVSIQSHAWGKYQQIFRRKRGKAFTFEDSDDEETSASVAEI